MAFLKLFNVSKEDVMALDVSNIATASRERKQWIQKAIEDSKLLDERIQSMQRTIMIGWMIITTQELLWEYKWNGEESDRLGWINFDQINCDLRDISQICNEKGLNNNNNRAQARITKVINHEFNALTDTICFLATYEDRNTQSKTTISITEREARLNGREAVHKYMDEVLLSSRMESL